MYTVKSTSVDGIYYLVNGWNTYKTWWTKTCSAFTNGFKTVASAKRSLSILLKYEPEFRNDTFELMEFKPTPVHVSFINVK